MQCFIPKSACALATVLLLAAGCEENKKGLQQDDPQAVADYSLEYLEPEAAEQAYESGPAYDSYSAADGTEELASSDTGAESPAPQGAQVHIVQPKETLCSIALKYYGTRSWRKIYEANRQRIADPNLIHPGMKLIIP